ncbi:MAG: FAD:protein FMN transferase, partial [Candidatus Delongbacteria bacterium]|nr:FAD:protein FMN transferase [Candidatus Delongbacteria bacterium]MCG2761029.1 FAD:protein FMN transferase [Candidatus Delongbacteria bacterium]
MRIRLVLINAILFAVLVSCSKNEKIKFSTTFVEFSTNVKITIYNVCLSDSSRVYDVFNKSEKIFEYFNSEMNPYDENSSLAKMNSHFQDQKIGIPESLKEIIQISRNIYKYTGRAFDVAVLPIVELWGFYSLSSPKVPDKQELAELLAVSNLENYIFDGDSVTVKDSRCKIGLGGIAKGYAIDSVAAFIKQKGFKDFIVEAGGDLIVKSSTGKTIGIKHPRSENELIDTLYISDAAVATSGDYEKFIIEDGRRYCHIINPETGYGISDCVGITIISDKAYMSDAFATAVFVMGREKGKHFIEKN